MTTNPAARLGGFFTGAGRSDVVDLYAAACAMIADETGVRDGSVKTRGWAIRADQMVTGAAGNGRAVFGYPAPGNPAWVTSSPGSGALLASGVDFSVSGGYVWFVTDPLPTASVSYLVWVDGFPVTAADAWWGEYKAPPAGTEPLEATVAVLSKAISAVCNSPATTGEYETVEEVWLGEDEAYRIVTDIAGYVLPAGDTPAVEAGDVVPLGSPLGTAWTLTRLGPSKPNLPWFTTPPSPNPFHFSYLSAGITWYDQTVPLVVDTLGGRTRVRWALGTTSPQLAAFWTASHSIGTEPGARSLAQAMDTRANPVGDPGPESLPTHVNPLEFVCRELFAGTAYCLIVRPAKFGPAGETDAAIRAAAIRAAAGPNVIVFEYEGEIPSLPPVTPT